MEEKKLKTLKELGLSDFDTQEKTGFCSMNELRQEARKWIKDIEKNKQLNSDKYDRIFKTYWMTEKELDAMIMWIKHFFNLEE